MNPIGPMNALELWAKRFRNRITSPTSSWIWHAIRIRDVRRWNSGLSDFAIERPHPLRVEFEKTIKLVMQGAGTLG